ncbi:glycosyltransferase family 2 protein [Zunongwangia atlantica]|uniref:Putative glycosyltransferase n=1 Tax=Zunongwangia atlantica 22II14-10F7 TaxID=1185767 RepID=A0A1Y1T8P1_9FLAO|nr:glycosyltransferase family 2 protein [Zunongwangia atlantica]ORL47419.1 putative glycosyltransferase [Zunongwangia atlantica 22II14-10F7]
MSFSFKINIVIVTYNGIKWIDKCLQSCGDYPVIVVDNNSSDNTLGFIKKKYPTVHIIKQDKNLGFGQANNIGISYALNHGADFVFLLNQDAYLSGNCLEKLIKVKSRNSEYGVLSPIHLNGEGTRIDSKFSKYLLNNEDFYSDHILNKPLKNVYDFPFVNAAGWLISRECLETVGGFDPMFFHYGEDDNYCQRLNYHGFKLGVVSEVFLRHDRIQEGNPINTKSLLYLERRYKLEYGNLKRNDFEIQFKHKILGLNKSILKNTLFFKFKKSAELRKRLKLVYKIKNEIAVSRNINAVEGASYLEL